MSMDEEWQAPQPDKVGPGNPPKEYRWQPGCPSSNPKGRPPSRKRQNALVPNDKFAELVERIGSKLVAGEGSPEYREMVFYHLHAIAFGKSDEYGDVKSGSRMRGSDRLAALKHLSELDREATRRLSEEREKQFDGALSYKEYWTGRFHKAEKAGRPVPDTLPHPDDLIIHMPSGRVSIVGPVTPAQQIELESQVAHRDVMIENLHKLLKKDSTADTRRLIKKYRKILGGFNEILPPRLMKEVP